MSIKIRTIIITLIASASFAAATVAPAVSRAEAPTGSGDPSTVDPCNDLWIQWKVEAISYSEHMVRLEFTWAAVNLAYERKVIQAAEALGCSWVDEDDRPAPTPPTHQAGGPSPLPNA